MAGFKPDTLKYFPMPALNFSIISKKKTNFALGAVLGVFIGPYSALLMHYEGVCTQGDQLLLTRNKCLSVQIGLKNWMLKSSSLPSALNNREINELDEASVYQQTSCLFCGSRGRPTAAQTARLLATQSSKSGKNIVLCDVSNQSNKEIEAYHNCYKRYYCLKS